MINIIDEIRSKLDFTFDDDFYLVEIIKRRKENPPMTVGQKMIDYYEIHSLTDFDEKIESIKNKCRLHNARAYIHLNRRNKKKIALEMLRELANRIANGDYNTRNIYHSMLGKYHSDKNKKWIIDIDHQDESVLLPIMIRLENFYKSTKKHLYELWVNPSLNGNHIICSPFDVNKIDLDKNINILKDNGTVLYFDGLKL